MRVDALVMHHPDEERSGIYERLVAVEELAKSAKRGIHSAREPASVRPNDVSTPANAARAKAFLQSFQRAGKLQVRLGSMRVCHGAGCVECVDGVAHYVAGSMTVSVL